jgi:dipeptidyl aminopeptidase/acylaminoacyl peptidase
MLRMVQKAAAAVVCAFVGSQLFVSPARAVLPIEAYGEDPAVSDVALSGDGRKVAMVKSDNGKSRLVVLDRTTQKAGAYDLRDMKVRNIEWSSADHVLVYVTKTVVAPVFASSLLEYCAVFSINTRTSAAPQQLLMKNRDLAIQSHLCGVESRLWNETGDVLMRARRGDLRDKEEVEGVLYRVNGDTGMGEVVARGSRFTNAWVASPKGHVIARISMQDGKVDRYRVAVPTSEDRMGNWKEVFGEDTDLPEVHVYGVNERESALVVGTDEKSGLYGLFEMSLNDGKLGKSVFEADGVDVGGVVIDPYTGVVVGASYDTLRPEQMFFQTDLQTVLGNVRKALPQWQTVVLRGWDRDRKTFLFFAQGDMSAGDYFILDSAKGKMEHVAAVRPNIKPADLGQVRAFTYKARDDMALQGFLTLPPAYSKVEKPQNLPLVVFPHGGPASRDRIQFDYWAQAMASRGYVVVQMNFRGSTGYGEKFQDAGHGEWGAKMQDDVTDAAQHLIKEGIADPKRICIVGASYGGYSALAGAAYTPDLYKCAVGLGGVYDLARMLRWEEERYGRDNATSSYWSQSIGNLREESDKVAARSPINAVDKIRADVLLMHGQDDTVVPYSQSETMADAMRKAGKAVQMITIEGEDHWLSTPKTRTAMLTALDGFLAKHLGTAN